VPECKTIAWQPIRGRLTKSRTELDETLMRLGLSTHPALVVGLEGKTEMTAIIGAGRSVGAGERECAHDVWETAAEP
jgi:hypothetical protein